MKKRIKLIDRILPNYSRGEEQMNTVTHIIGGGFAVVMLVLCLVRAAMLGNPWAVVSSSIYGATLVAMYTVSSVYHGLPAGMGKKVMQVIDHCAIYFLIAGTYTVIVLTALRPVYPVLGWGLFAAEWILVAVAATLTAIDLEKYDVFSMVCYIGMGWAIIPFWRSALQALSRPGFLLILLGGIVYSIGAILYSIGSRKKWMHSVFHIFVIAGSLLHFLAIIQYVIK